MLRKVLFVAIVLLLLPTLAPAFETGGVTFPLELKAGDQSLILNGAGLRKKFVIKVYACALYLTERNNSAESILDSDAPMAIRMQFIRGGIEPKTLVESWNESFSHTAAGQMDALSERIAAFNACFTEETAEGDKWDMVYLPGRGVEVELNGQTKATIPGLDFKKALFAIWLGDSPPSKDLKEGMLGEP